MTIITRKAIEQHRSAGPWRELEAIAQELTADARANGGSFINPILGGGTRLMLALEHRISDDNGKQIPILQSCARIGNRTRYADDPEGCEYLVRVNWLKTLDRVSAIKEKGLFGNQNTVARSTKPKWGYTVQRLKARLGITE